MEGVQARAIRALAEASNLVGYKNAHQDLTHIQEIAIDEHCVRRFCNPSGWRLQTTRILRALVSPPPMSSRHRILEPYGRWHATICTVVNGNVPAPRF